jgi:hypothetical protein
MIGVLGWWVQRSFGRKSVPEQDDDLACARGILNGIAIEIFAGVVLALAIWAFFV